MNHIEIQGANENNTLLHYKIRNKLIYIHLVSKQHLVFFSYLMELHWYKYYIVNYENYLLQSIIFISELKFHVLQDY